MKNCEKILIERPPMDLEKFLMKFKDILLDDHKAELHRLNGLVEKYRNQAIVFSKYGKHYESCVWSSDSAQMGPDTCECHHVKTAEIKIKKIFDLYQKIPTHPISKCCEVIRDEFPEIDCAVAKDSKISRL